VPWTPVSDLVPIVQGSGTTFGLLVPADSPWKSLADLLDWARAHPGQLLMGSTGIGTTEQMLAIASGQLMAGVNSTGFSPWVDQNKIRLLAIFSPRHRAALARYDQDINYLDTAAYQQAIGETVKREKALLGRMKLLAAGLS
jgi:tripartite-type tricarboxylate transporter receptor subunit TctC